MAAALALCVAAACVLPARSALLTHGPPLAATPRVAARLPRVACEARPIPLLENQEEYEALVASAQAENRLVVIKFFASWCRACKAMAPKYTRLTEDWPNIEFYELMFDNNKKLCKSLGIKILPYIQIVKGEEGIVESFTCGPSKISRLQEKLEEHGIVDKPDYPEFTDVSSLLVD
mmetsp:Transcript_35563/g.88492  ORF Transcript_35563/g.88492 Transcript_35563/m.88492 type:complete len:176 (-) Transcript_35563:394-921(-)